MSLAFAIPMLAAAAGVPDGCGSSGVQSEMNDCALADFNRADGVLNAQRRTTLAVMQGRDKQGDGADNETRLRKAQRAWIAYRDAHCQSAHPWSTGANLNKMLDIDCRTQLTAGRTQQLKDLEQGY